MTPAVYLEHFQARVLQDALAEATSSYWLHRAEQLEDARPRPGEHHGSLTVEQLRGKWVELSETAEACRHAAAMAPLQDDGGQALDAVREAAA